MKARALDHWVKVRALGFWWFVLVCGVMGWGMTMAVVMLLIFEWLPIPHGPILHPITKVAAMCGVGGFVFGLGTWTASERQYHRHCPPPGFDVVPRKG